MAKEYFCAGCCKYRKQPLKSMQPGVRPKCTVCLEKIAKSSRPEDEVAYTWKNGNTVTVGMQKKGKDKRIRKEYLNDKIYISDDK